MRLFDGHAILRLALLFTCVVFAGLIPEIISFSGSVFFVVNYILAIGILLYLALFHKFPVSANIRKLRNDVDIPEVTSVEPSRDFQKDLIEKDEMLQMMVDASSDGFWTFDVPTGKVYWSNRVAKLLGIDPDQVDDTFETLKRCVIESDWEVFRKEMAKSLNENRPFNLSLRLVSASDSPKELTVSGRPQFNEEGRPIRLIGFLGERMSTAAMERQKYYYAYQDALTGVYNRKFFLEKLKVDIDNAAKRPDYMFAVALLDIDSFGAINDSFSTNFGDNVLRVVADRIKGSCRDNDCVARIGPDVFAVVLHNIQGADPDDDLMPIVRRLHNKVKAPVNLEGRELYISVSMAVVVNRDVDCVEDIMANASAILRDLKKNGDHGGIQFFTGGIREKAMKLYKLEYEIRRAIQAKEFILMYQPIVDINAGNSVVGFEALVRWNNTEQGIVSPAEFIPIAEETGLIVPMGALILRMACEQTRKWVEQGYENIKVAVNFSAKQFALDNMVEDVRRVLTETHLNPKNLKLEITEYTAMCEVEKTIDIMRSLSSMGLQISIDDFGTGYSSLSYLKRYPIHTLKMDKSFIDHVADDEEDASFARMVISIAKSLNLDLIAEGVETAEQLEFLRREGCRQIQGYYFSKPLSPDAAFEYLKAHDGTQVSV
ncbi:GGDEF and EAL domain-containing protein [uncultured Fibrobacter sp.]|uniref:bifunctional diguanylate cyclase/phosphodiesterase n=1 Tax=uncultured Fibrobacter sp. TaxID=261512 RepID=UPI0025E73128|nr:GGDEF and EAL domain-containing protein [uncultured Fibrobacter sp.]